MIKIIQVDKKVNYLMKNQVREIRHDLLKKEAKAIFLDGANVVYYDVKQIKFY